MLDITAHWAIQKLFNQKYNVMCNQRCRGVWTSWYNTLIQLNNFKVAMDKGTVPFV